MVSLQQLFLFILTNLYSLVFSSAFYKFVFVIHGAIQSQAHTPDQRASSSTPTRWQGSLVVGCCLLAVVPYSSVHWMFLLVVHLLSPRRHRSSSFLLLSRPVRSRVVLILGHSWPHRGASLHFVSYSVQVDIVWIIAVTVLYKGNSFID